MVGLPIWFPGYVGDRAQNDIRYMRIYYQRRITGFDQYGRRQEFDIERSRLFDGSEVVLHQDHKALFAKVMNHRFWQSCFCGTPSGNDVSCVDVWFHAEVARNKGLRTGSVQRDRVITDYLLLDIERSIAFTISSSIYAKTRDILLERSEFEHNTEDFILADWAEDNGLVHCQTLRDFSELQLDRIELIKMNNSEYSSYLYAVQTACHRHHRLPKK